LIEKLKYQWKNATILIKVLVILAVFFTVQTLIYLTTQHYVNESLLSWFALNNDFKVFLQKPWTLISHAFFHKNVNHFLGNLIFLYFIGREFLNLFLTKQFLQSLFGGVLFGALFFILATNFIPNYQGEAFLLGISAGILSLLMTIAAYRPKYNVYFTENAKVAVWIIALVVLLYILLTANKNAGANFAHFGGIVFGVIFALYLKGDLFKIKNTHLKTVHRSVIKSTQHFTVEEQEQIDKILDKMNQSGYDSLSKKEKQYLFKRGK
jgi:membrane associated rhomboid family serine protease